MTKLADKTNLFPKADAQVSLLPASNDFIPIILKAVSNIGAVDGLTASTDAISTHLSARADIMFDTIADVVTRAAESGAHLIFPILAAARDDGSPSAAELTTAYVVPSGKSSTAIASQFSLNGNSRHVASLQREAIGFLTSLGLKVSSKTLVTRVDGPADVLFAAYAAILSSSTGQGLTLSVTAVANIPTAEAFV